MSTDFVKSSWSNDEQSICSAQTLLLKPFTWLLDSIAWEGELCCWFILKAIQGVTHSAANASVRCAFFICLSFFFLLNYALNINLWQIHHKDNAVLIADGNAER